MKEDMIFGLCLLVVGAGLWAFAAALVSRAVRIRQTWRRTTGVVVEADVGIVSAAGVDHSRTGGNSIVTIEFRDDGGTVRHATRQGLMREGTEVPILYDPRHPRNILYAARTDMLWVPVLLAAMGTAFLSFGIGVLTGHVAVTSK